MEGNHHEYRIICIHPETKIKVDIKRRFRHFDTLRNALNKKFDGLYIPPLPRKKKLNKTSEETAQLRTFILDKFIK